MLCYSIVSILAAKYTAPSGCPVLSSSFGYLSFLSLPSIGCLSEICNHNSRWKGYQSLNYSLNWQHHYPSVNLHARMYNNFVYTQAITNLRMWFEFNSGVLLCPQVYKGPHDTAVSLEDTSDLSVVFKWTNILDLLLAWRGYLNNCMAKENRRRALRTPTAVDVLNNLICGLYSILLCWPKDCGK